MITGPGRTVKLARKLRSEMTLPEVILWRALRRRPGGFKFRRQHPAGSYILDFYCARLSLAIEIDGVVHDAAGRIDHDAVRSHFLRSQGIATLRVPARVVLEDLNLVVTRIVVVCEERSARLAAKARVPLHHPADGPPPPDGEE